MQGSGRVRLLTTDAPLLQDDIAAVGHLMVMLAASAGAVPSLQHVAAHFSEQFASVLGSIEAGQIRDWHTVRAEAGCLPPGSSTLLLPGADHRLAHAEDMAAGIRGVVQSGQPCSASRCCLSHVLCPSCAVRLSSALLPFVQPVLSGVHRQASEQACLSRFTAKPAAAREPQTLSEPAPHCPVCSCAQCCTSTPSSS